jgi:hypothetical protein
MPDTKPRGGARAPAAPQRAHDAAASPPKERQLLAPASGVSTPPTNYKVSVHVAAKPTGNFYRMRATLDTGAGSNFIRTSNVPPDSRIDPTGGRWRFIDANGRPLHITGLTTLITRLGDFTVPVEFLVVDSLSASMILGCSFIDTHVRSIRPKYKRVSFHQGTFVPIRATSMTGSSVRGGALPPPEDPRIRLRNWLSLEPGRTVCIKVRSMVTGLAFLRPLIEQIDPRVRVQIHNRIEEVIAGKDFNVKVSNRSQAPVNLSKDVVIGWAQRMVTR